jgi:hypothetical protein
LIHQGFITSSSNDGDGRFQLTQAGVSNLLLFRLYNAPSPVSKFLFRDADPTTHMMIQMLEDQGWVWQILPSPKKRKVEHDAYIIGAEKIWRTSSLTVHRAYLQCLLEADNLRSEHGIHAIPHGCTQSVYSDLLKGVQPSPVTKAPRFTLEDDLPQTQLLSQDPQAEDDRLGTLAIDDDDYSPTEYGEDSANRILDLIFEDNMHDDSKVVDRASDPGESQMLRVLQDGSSELEKPVARAEADMGPCQSEPADTERRKIVAMSVNEASTAGYDWRSFKWGAFRFTSKRPSKIGSDGQGSFVWQASCPFHAKNQKTGCRKSCNVSPLTPENFRNVIKLFESMVQ